MRLFHPSHRSVVRLAALALAVSMAFGCGRQASVGPAASTGELPDQEVSDFVLTETDQGNVQWTLYARYAATFSSRNQTTARGVRVDFFDPKGKKSSELTAREGEINDRTHDMIARGNVVLQSAEGTRMSTQSMRFLNREQKIVSEEFVRVERAGDVLTGYGFESDPELRHFEFKRQVNATVRTNSGGVIGTGAGK
jgi:LPS export ABC transporter protein LptC